MLCLSRVRRRCRGVNAVRVLLYLGVVLLCWGLGVRCIVLVGTGGNSSSWRSTSGGGGGERGQSHRAQNSPGSNPEVQVSKPTGFKATGGEVPPLLENSLRSNPDSAQKSKYQNPADSKPQEENSQDHKAPRAERSWHRKHSLPSQASQGRDPSQHDSHSSRRQAARRRQADRMADTGGSKADFNGKWKMVKSEHFEEFLAANGANWMMRKMASKISPSVEITQDGDNFCIKTVTPVRTQEDKFTIGTPYEHEAMGGVKMKVTPSWDGEALLLENEPQEAGKGKPSSIWRQIVDGQLVLTMKVGDVVCKRWFDKV